MEFDPTSYGPIFEPLLTINRSRALDAGRPAPDAFAALKALTVDSAFVHTKVTDANMARCCLSGVWLLHDFLDESHTISQGIETTEGSFWHGIMHRREGDFSNAKYWFRRVGKHAIFEELGLRAKSLGLGADDLWDPYSFVDACQRAVRSGEGAELCRAVQQAEWELLFEYCYRATCFD